MAQTILTRLIVHRQQEMNDLLEQFRTQFGCSFQILDPDGRPLCPPLSDPARESAGQVPVQDKGEVLGWVAGGMGAELLALFLSRLVVLEEEKRALANETINRYREINLLYRLSEKLAASLEVRTIALTVIEEARLLIKCSTGALLLLNKQTNALDWLAGIGPERPPIPIGEGIQGRVAQTARAEVINNVCLAPGHSPAEAGFCALLCSPLLSQERVIGILMLAGDKLINYTAGDLKLLTALAIQATPAIENALLHEAALREARAREERLQRQIQALRIELDENRQTKKAGEITETDYFRNLQLQAGRLRQIVEGSDNLTEG